MTTRRLSITVYAAEEFAALTALPLFARLVRRYRWLFGVLVPANEQRSFEDSVLEFVVPPFAPYISRFYLGDGPALEELISADALARLDRDLAHRAQRFVRKVRQLADQEEEARDPLPGFMLRNGLRTLSGGHPVAHGPAS